MLKVISIKLTKVGKSSGPFCIYDQYGVLIAKDVSRKTLMEGVSYTVDDSVTMLRLVSTGACQMEKVKALNDVTEGDFFGTETQLISTGCIWKHLTNPEINNSFYGKIDPYVIEYPFAYKYFDEIVQNVKDYTKVYRYTSDDYGVANEVNKIELNDVWFNKAIVYNGQQSSGILNLVPKPKHNLKEYMSYPIYNEDSKTIMFTKSDNYYQYNTFWSIVKDVTLPIFIRSCSPLSYDKELNQSNMEYGMRSFRKEPIRAKDLKVRHILDDRSDVRLVSQIMFTPSQISYK